MGPLLGMVASACKCVFSTVAFSSQLVQTCEPQIGRKTPKTSMSRELGDLRRDIVKRPFAQSSI